MHPSMVLKENFNMHKWLSQSYHKVHAHKKSVYLARDLIVAAKVGVCAPWSPRKKICIPFLPLGPSRCLPPSASIADYQPFGLRSELNNKQIRHTARKQETRLFTS
eukprot:968321-Pleurochrysis_carterae.AAC.6